MANKPKLRPINETRRPDGTLTSETAARLFRRRGGLARARQMAADGFQHLHRIRLLSVLANRAKGLQTRPCHQCKAFQETVLALLATEHPKVYAAITEQDARLLR